MEAARSTVDAGRGADVDACNSCLAVSSLLEGAAAYGSLLAEHPKFIRVAHMELKGACFSRRIPVGRNERSVIQSGQITMLALTVVLPPLPPMPPAPPLPPV